MMSSVLRDYARGRDFRSVARGIQEPSDRRVILGASRKSRLMWINVSGQSCHYGTDRSFHCDGTGGQNGALATGPEKGAADRAA